MSCRAARRRRGHVLSGRRARPRGRGRRAARRRRAARAAARLSRRRWSCRTPATSIPARVAARAYDELAAARGMRAPRGAARPGAPRAGARPRGAERRGVRHAARAGAHRPRGAAQRCATCRRWWRATPAHALEHSLEVQLPFLQKMLGEFALVPFAVGTASVAGGGRRCSSACGAAPETLIVISTDLSHYHAYDAGARHRRRDARAHRGASPPTSITRRPAARRR